MKRITDTAFDPKEEDVLLKLTMPKRELRLSTVMKMQQQKQKEAQEKQTQLTQSQNQSPSPQQIPTPVQPPEQKAAAQQDPTQINQPELTPTNNQTPEPTEQKGIAIQSTKEEQPPQPMPEQPPQPELKEQPQQWHPQMLTPEREGPATANTSHTNLDMSRIENLTRHIMYRDPQRSGFGKGKSGA